MAADVPLSTSRAPRRKAHPSIPRLELLNWESMNMATIDEYRAVHGGDGPPKRKRTTAELGDGGCNVIFNGNREIIGRWSSWETASRALNRLQQLGIHYEYRLEETHRWVKGPGATTQCTRCNTTRQIAAAVSILWS
ncbi:hypothetical protein LJR013_003598 [Pseudarthrobacter oxydans]|uniref:hypothetical protein n=1 Tax=Pseudarthrobacter oxydans TaxID=1671 RepID=UPI003ED12A72